MKKENNSKSSIGELKLKKAEEKREYPRIIIDCPVSLMLADAVVLKATAYDISPGGLQIQCNKKTAHQLLEKTKKANKKTSPGFGVSLSLPLDGKQAKLVSLCKHIYLVSLEDDLFAIGLSFTGLKGKSKSVLKRFIEASMEPE